MKRKFGTLFILCLLLAVTGYGQLCGGSTFKLRHYVLNRERLSGVTYELIDLSEVQRKKLDSLNVNSFQSIREGFLLSPHHLLAVWGKDSIAGGRPLTGSTELGIWSGNSNYSRSSKITVTQSGIDFQTTELYHHPYLLKVTRGRERYFIVANFFGGCNPYLDLIWRENGQVAVSHY